MLQGIPILSAIFLCHPYIPHSYSLVPSLFMLSDDSSILDSSWRLFCCRFVCMHVHVCLTAHCLLCVVHVPVNDQAIGKKIPCCSVLLCVMYVVRFLTIPKHSLHVPISLQNVIETCIFPVSFVVVCKHSVYNIITLFIRLYTYQV